MIVSSILGSVRGFNIGDRTIDSVTIEWYEASKRIMHKRSAAGLELACKFLGETHLLKEGDVLFVNDESVVVVNVAPCDAIVIRATDSFQLASACYEIGNKHLPLFYEDGDLLVPYDAPLFRLLTAQEYNLVREERKLLHPLRTSVKPHSDGNSTSLFSKIMKLTQ